MKGYVRFDNMFPAFRGGVAVGAHAGWSPLRSVEFGGLRTVAEVQAARETSGVHLNDIIISKLNDCASPTLYQVCAAGTHIPGGNDAIVARIDFTGADGRGTEITTLSIALHDVAISLDKTTPGVGGPGTPLERYRLRYSKMTYANMPPSSPDVSQAVVASLMRQQAAQRSGDGPGDIGMIRPGNYQTGGRARSHHSGGMVVVLMDGSHR